MPIKTSHLREVVRVAHKSEHSAKHAAILIKKGKVLAVTNNRYCSKLKLGHFHSDRVWSIHAEMSLASIFPKKVTRGATVCVVRVDKKGDLVNSEPCSLCKTILITMGVRRVYYS
jgi:tRNA(Arg) A34 adenosine deaminase TadA